MPSSPEVPPQAGGRGAEESPLTNLLTETRILLLGTQVFLGFLATVPFSHRFVLLDGPRRAVYLCTFLATVLALVLFVVPASYHRLARPVMHTERFKAFANLFLVVGLVPMSIAIVLVSYLVAYLVFEPLAPYAGAAVGVLIGTVWWATPLLRLHDRFPRQGLTAGWGRGKTVSTCSPTRSNPSSTS